MKETIIRILVEICKTDEIREHQELDLFDAGLLDSMSYVELLIRLEQAFAIELPPSEINREAMSSVTKIMQSISNKCA